MNLLKISNLPDCIIELIKEFIPRESLVFLNKNFYESYHYLIKNCIINTNLYENYVRDMIRKDNGFVFEMIIRENIDYWLKSKSYRYKNMIFNNYIYFVIHYCIENNSDNCRKIIIDFMSKRDLCKNLHKKNVVKYIKWNN
jgi:hypothetical protein